MSELRLLLHKEESGVFVPVLDTDFFQNHNHSFSSLTGKPTTLAGYGITNAATSGHSHTFASITSKPTSLAGYGIIDAAPISHSHTFSSLTSKPTTVSGYGITDAAKLGSDNVFTGEQEFQNNSIFFGDITIDGSIVTFDAGTTFDYATGIAATHRTALGLGTLATQSGTFSGTSSGNNTGDQTITLTGVVTGSGTGSFTTSIANNALSIAKTSGLQAALDSKAAASDVPFATGTLGFDSSPKELTAARIKRWDVSWIVSGGTRKIRLPYTGVVKGDIIVLTVTAPAVTTVQIETYLLGPGWSVIETLTTGQSLTKTWVYDGFNWKDLDYWLGVPSVISGSVATTGTATTTFAVSIGRTLADTNYRVSVTPLNSLSSPVNYVSGKTTTGFNVVYLSGLTGAVAFDWMVVPVVP